MYPGILPALRRCAPLIVVLLASCALATPSCAATGPAILVYSTDFSSDPGWVTNNPATNYYDAEKGMFHYLMRDGTGAYVYHPVSYGGEAFTLSFDILPERTDYQASTNFGLGDSDQWTDHRQTMFTEFQNGQYGRILWIRSIDLLNQRREASSYFLSYGGPTVQFADGTWYHVIMDYRPDARSLSVSVYRRNDSSAVWHYTLDSMSPFPTMNRIYMSKVGESGNPSAIAEGYLDNVAFSIYFPAETPRQGTTASPPTGSSPAQVTTAPATVPPAGTPPATEPVPLTPLPVLGALALAIPGMGIRLARKRP